MYVPTSQPQDAMLSMAQEFADGLGGVLTPGARVQSLNAYMSVQGSKQGVFKGEGARPGQISILQFTYEVKAPRDVATGQASGRRLHSPVMVTKELGAASPQLFTALVANEILPSVQIQFFRTRVDGKEELYHTVRLTNATVVRVRHHMHNPEVVGLSPGRALEDVAFTFQRIEIQNNVGKTMGIDDWSGAP